jgi:hypothetical protein
MDDQYCRALVNKCLNGETDAFDELVNHHQFAMYNTVFQIVDPGCIHQSLGESAYLRYEVPFLQLVVQNYGKRSPEYGAVKTGTLRTETGK